MHYWERHLPHWIPDQVPIFVTFRLAGSLPHKPGGPQSLAQPLIAQVVEDALHYGETSKGWYQLHAWVLMPNHVHILITPQHDFSKVMQWLKWTTARRANILLGRTRLKFWQDESYDHWIRDEDEFYRALQYVEYNPVTAGLTERPEDWPWSSAHVKQAILSPVARE